VDELLGTALATHGYVTTRDVRRHVDRVGPDRMVRRGELVRVRNGVFVDRARYASADPVARHVAAARAVVGMLGEGYAVSHLSAVALHGLPVLRSDLGKVHVCAIEHGKPRADRQIQAHSPLPKALVGDVAGTAVVAPVVAVLQAAAHTGVRAGIVAADAAPRIGLAREDLAVALEVARLRRGRGVAARVAALPMVGPSRPAHHGARLVIAEVSRLPSCKVWSSTRPEPSWRGWTSRSGASAWSWSSTAP
jgi:hypothetical protein